MIRNKITELMKKKTQLYQDGDKKINNNKIKKRIPNRMEHN